jgi:hypothetical protein
MKRWRRNNSTPPSDPNPTRFNLEVLEPRDVPSSTGAVALINPNPFTVPVGPQEVSVDTTVPTVQTVSLVTATGATLLSEITPFPGFAGQIVASTGDVNGDGTPDLIVAAQFPDIPVKVFDGATGNLLQSFYAFPGFAGTVNVGSADVNGNGFADVLVAANAANGHIKAFSGVDGSLLSSFLAFPGYMGQVSVAGADFNHSGHDQILVGAGAPGVGGRLAIFNPDGSLSNGGILAFPGFGGAISVAAGDTTGSGTPNIIVGAGPGGPGGEVEVFRGTDFALISAFLPLDPGDPEGVLLGTGDFNGDGRPDVLVVPAANQTNSFTPFDGLTGVNLNPPSPDSYSC